jgi:hypothetical protein
MPTALQIDTRYGAVLVRPSPTAEFSIRQVAGARQLHNIERSATFYRSSASPVVPAARHGL